jgi:hypothetical protein
LLNQQQDQTLQTLVRRQVTVTTLTTAASFEPQ